MSPSGVRSSARAPPPTAPPAGIALGTYLSGSASLERFRITQNAFIGVQIALDGELSLSDGEVAGNPIGANLQVPGYDIGRLSDRVLYRDNGTNLDAADLYIPNPTTPGG